MNHLCIVPGLNRLDSTARMENENYAGTFKIGSE